MDFVKQFESLIHPIASALSIHVLRPLTEDRVYTIRSGIAKGLKTRGGLDFIPRPMKKEDRFIRSLNLSSKVVYDVGGFEGQFAAAFARLAGPTGTVIVFEPNPVNRTYIDRIVSLNGFQNVRVLPIALGAVHSSATMVVPQHERSMGTLDTTIAAQIAESGDAETFSVDIQPLDALIADEKLPPPDFIKIDVEGFEVEVLNGMAETLRRGHPAVFVELHGVTPEQQLEIAQQVIEFLTSLGYQLTHVESNTSIDDHRADCTLGGHLYAIADTGGN